MFDTVEDARLVERAAAGDQQAWNDLVREHGGRLRAIAAGFRLSRADAEDALQVTWMSLVTSLRTLRSYDRVGAWLATTMRRNCLRILQRQRWETPVEDLRAVAVDHAAIDRNLLLTEQAGALWQAVGRLSARQQRLLRALFAENEPSYHEIATALAMPIGAIGPSRQRALHRLAQLLGETHDDLRIPA